MLNENTVTVHPAQTTHEPWGVLVQIFFVLGCAWLIVGHRYFMEGDNMERPANRIAQLYGYAVCLIAVVIFLITVRSIAGALITLSNPLAEPNGYGQSLDSFESYKATFNEPNGAYVSEPGVARTERPLPDDAVLRQRYEALRADRIASNIYQAKTDITLNGLMLVIAIVLFVLHWRWLRTLASA